MNEWVIGLFGKVVGKKEGECPNDPGKEFRRQDATCHVCHRWASCGFCNICCHWFCRECNPKIFARGMAAVKELVKGAEEGCCGPHICHWPQASMGQRHPGQADGVMTVHINGDKFDVPAQEFHDRMASEDCVTVTTWIEMMGTPWGRF